MSKFIPKLRTPHSELRTVFKMDNELIENNGVIESSAYNINLPVFAGPMDLLLTLIEKHKIDIYDIPMAVITSEYLDYLAQLKGFAIEPASEFLVMAATLLLIKSRMMLPKAKVDATADGENPDEADGEKDPRSELVSRIIEYRRFKEAAVKLSALYDDASRFIAAPEAVIPRRRQLETKLSPADLLAAFQVVLSTQNAQTAPAFSIVRERYTVKERMGYIATRLRQLGREGVPIKFTALFAEIDREECITTFLALLELIKLGEAFVEQGENFGEIVIYAS